MGNCMSWIKEKKAPGRKVTLSILGLDNAGKTVTAKSLQKESIDNVAPTVGFTSITFKHKKHEIVMFDLGGGKRIRDIWKNYYAESYGIIYVVDSTDRHRLSESRHVLRKMVEHPLVAGKPMLLLCNKQDAEGAMDEIELTESLDLEGLVNMSKTPCKVELCSAVFRKGKTIDKAIERGLDWMMEHILTNWEKYSLRVEEDKKEQKEKEEQENVERKERVRRIREERERKEKMERRKKGLPDEDESDEERDVGDPFRRMDQNQMGKQASPKLSRRFAAQQNSARRSKKYDDDDDDQENYTSKNKKSGNVLHTYGRSFDEDDLTRNNHGRHSYRRQVDSDEDSQDSETGQTKKNTMYSRETESRHTPRSSRSDGYLDDMGYGSSSTKQRHGDNSPRFSRRYNSRNKKDSDDDEEDSDVGRYSRSVKRSGQSDRQRRPESPDRYGRSHRGSSRYDRSDDDDDDDKDLHDKVDTYRSWNPEKRTPRPKDASPPRYGRMTRSYTDDDVIGRSSGSFDLKPLGHRGLAPLPQLAPLEPLDSLGDDNSSTTKKKKNKRKKKAKKNQTVPSPEMVDSDDDHNRYRGGGGNSGSNWQPSGSTGSRGFIRASRSPKLATLQEPDDSDDMSKARRWDLADDIDDYAIHSRSSRRANGDLYNHDLVS